MILACPHLWWCHSKSGAISQLRLMKFHQKPFGLGLCNESFDAGWLFVFGWHKALARVQFCKSSRVPLLSDPLFDPNRVHQPVPAAICGPAHLSERRGDDNGFDFLTYIYESLWEIKMFKESVLNQMPDWCTKDQCRLFLFVLCLCWIDWQWWSWWCCCWKERQWG